MYTDILDLYTFMLENDLFDSTEVGGIDFRLTGLVLLASKRVVSFLMICDDAADSLWFFF
jgi:hypothetical protein